MKRSIAIFIALISSHFIYAQCEINVSADPLEIVCGQSVTLSAYGSSTGQVVLDEDFNSGGFGPGWSSTPGATSFSNPCSPGGVDGTPHAWMDNNTAVPRTLESAPYDLSAATAGVTICFDMLFAEQGDAAPCEGPDEPDEGVYLQYSTDGGATWIDIHYFDPNGGSDPQLTNWNTWCFELPLAAITSSTIIRWHQTADSGADYDHWGIDNVQIFQNDINSEIVWLHDGYSYGLGNPGGENPTQVVPTSTTTYTAQITTGTGDVCTADITVVVTPPNYDVNLSASPSNICSGDCATISGTAQVVVDPGGIEVYENSETSLITGSPGITLPFIGTTPGDISAQMNINVTTLNEPNVTPGLIQNVCITDFSIGPGIGCTSTGLQDISFVLVCPDGTEVILANLGEMAGGNVSNMCFQDGAAAIGTGSDPYSGTFNPSQPLSNITGCTSNGVWSLEVRGENMETCLPIGSIGGWSITFDDPAIYQPVCYDWTPTTGLSDPSNINTDACPTSTTTYNLEVTNCVPGCPTHTESVTITVDPCGCVPPAQTILPLTACTPNTLDLTDAIDPSSDPANLSYYANQTDAQNATNPLGSTSISSSGSYWVRAELPSDPSCFLVYEITVTINPIDDASFTLTDFCVGEANAATSIATPGGTFAFNPIPGGGVTIDANTGEISNATVGSIYSVEYTTSGSCPSSSIETVTVNLSSDASFTLTDFCEGTANGATNIATTGGTFSFSPPPGDGAIIDANTGEISNEIAGTTYSISYTTTGGCASSTTETVNVLTIDDASFALTDYCEGAVNAASAIVTPGGTFAFNPIPGGSVALNSSTGEITNGVGGTTYTVEYTTSGICPATAAQQVTVIVIDDPSFTLTNFCVGENNSATNITTPGGTFSFNPVPSDGATIDQNTGEISNGVAGSSYSIEYTTNGTCPSSSIESVNVTLLDDPSFTLSSFCQGQSNLATITGVSGGTFAFNPVPTDGAIIDNSTGEISNGISGTTYTVEYTTPAGSCQSSSTETVTVSSSDDPAFILTDYCEGSSNNATGIATPGGTFTLAPIPTDGASIDGATGEIFNGIGGTTYTVEYTTSPGPCQASTTQNITVLENPEIDQLTIVDESCLGNENGSIDITNITGGTGSYSFAWNIAPDPATSIVNNLAPGNYNVTITDNNTMCSSDSTIIIQAGPVCCDVVLDTLNTLPIDCSGMGGEINVFATGGDGNYSYSINNGVFGAASSFQNLTSGSYEIIVLDGSGICSDTINVALGTSNGPVIDSIHTQDPSCFGANDGSIIVFATGGTGNLSYELAMPVVTNSTGDFQGLVSGTYDIVVSDENSCQDISSVVLNDPDELNIQVDHTPVSCNGDNNGTISIMAQGGTPAYTYSINNGIDWSANSNFSNLNPQNYQVIVRDNNNCESVIEIINISEPALLESSVVLSNEICYSACNGSATITAQGGSLPYSYSFNGTNSNQIQEANLCPGNYPFQINDVNGCSINGSITILAAEEIIIDSIQIIDDGCSENCDGQIVVHAAENYTYTVGTESNNSGIFSNLCGGNYNILIEDHNGCLITETANITSSEPVDAYFTLSAPYLTINSATMQVFNESINADEYSWTITGTNGYVETYTQSEFTHNFPSDTGTYEICLTATNSSGCTDEYCRTITVRDEFTIYVPNAFTPDGDNYNEQFQAYIYGIDVYNFDMYIYNRWGEIVWESHDKDAAWDGTYQGKLVQDGVYVWVITIKDQYSDERKSFNGHITILK